MAALSEICFLHGAKLILDLIHGIGVVYHIQVDPLEVNAHPNILSVLRTHTIGAKYGLILISMKTAIFILLTSF